MSEGRRVVVTGIGVISPLGDTPASLHEALCRGESGLKALESFPTEGLEHPIGGEISGFTARDYLRPGNLRPLDRTAQLAASATHRALEQAGYGEDDLQEHDVGLVLGTLFGSIHTISAFDRRALEAGPQYAKPMDFANSVINAPAGQTAIWHRLRGVNSTICSGTASGALALAYGADLIRTGRADALVAGGADELCYESFLGFQRTGRTAPNNGGAPLPLPWHRQRNGFTLGEGAALMVLEAEEVAEARGARPLAIVRGQAAGFAPLLSGSPSGKLYKGLTAEEVFRQVVLEALEDAGADLAEVTAVSASASGSPEGDRCEGLGLRSLLAGLEVPVTAVKACLGEGLGASGALQAAVLLESLATGRLPGIPGLDDSDPETTPTGVSTEAQSLSGRLGLVTCLAFDGHTGALVLEILDTPSTAEDAG